MFKILLKTFFTCILFQLAQSVFTTDDIIKRWPICSSKIKMVDMEFFFSFKQSGSRYWKRPGNHSEYMGCAIPLLRDALFEENADYYAFLINPATGEVEGGLTAQGGHFISGVISQSLTVLQEALNTFPGGTLFDEVYIFENEELPYSRGLRVVFHDTPTKNQILFWSWYTSENKTVGITPGVWHPEEDYINHMNIIMKNKD